MKTSLSSLLILAVACVLFNSTGRSQPGSIDPSFDPGASVDFTVWPIAVQSDGKIFIGGAFGTPHSGISRLNLDGSVDASFNPGKGVGTYGYVLGVSYIYSVALQEDGKMIVGGTFTTFDGTNRTHIARLNANGSLDPSFNPQLGAYLGYVYSTVVQPDGKILIGGAFTTVNNTARNQIARLNSDGTLDTNFVPATISFSVYSIALQSDGKVLLGGQAAGFSGSNLARLNSNGSLDASFDIGTGPNSNVRSLALQSDGKVILGGDFTAINGTNRARVARLETNGVLDSSFIPATIGGGVPFVYSLASQPDNKVLIAGTFTGVGGMSRNRIARLNSDGSLDTGFNPGTGADGSVFSVVRMANGKVLVGGTFTTVNNVGRNYTAQLDATGALDDSFTTGNSANTTAYAVNLRPDGKVYLAGSFTNIDRTARSGVARLNSNGSLDSGFTPDVVAGLGGSGPSVFAVASQADNKVLIGGFFTTVAGHTRNGYARLHPNGSLDTDYNPNLSAFSQVLAIDVQANGKTLIGGSFASINGTARPGIALLNLNAVWMKVLIRASDQTTPCAQSLCSRMEKFLLAGISHLTLARTAIALRG